MAKKIRIDTRARQLSQKFGVPAHKRTHLKRYWLCAVETTQTDANKTAEKQRSDKKYVTWVYGFTKKQGGKYGVYIRKR